MNFVENYPKETKVGRGIWSYPIKKVMESCGKTRIAK